MLSKQTSTIQDIPPVLGSLVEVQKGNGSRIYVMTSDLQKKFALKMVGNHFSERRQDLEKEFQILQDLNSEHIVRVFGSLLKDFSYGGNKHSCMIMEYARKGTLLELLNFFQTPSPNVIRKMFQDIGHGLHYLHYNGVAHLDLKLENILVFSLYNVKIADFGLSESKEIRNLLKYVGTPYYMPPEIIQIKKDFEEKRQLQPYRGDKADIFSFGVMLSIMVFGFPIFKNADIQDQDFKLIAEGKWDDLWSQTKVSTRLDSLELEVGAMVEDLKDLLMGLLNANPTERLNIIEVLEHPWFCGAVTSPREFYEGKIALMRLERSKTVRV